MRHRSRRAMEQIKASAGVIGRLACALQAIGGRAASGNGVAASRVASG